MADSIFLAEGRARTRELDRPPGRPDRALEHDHWRLRRRARQAGDRGPAPAAAGRREGTGGGAARQDRALLPSRGRVRHDRARRAQHGGQRRRHHARGRTRARARRRAPAPRLLDRGGRHLQGRVRRGHVRRGPAAAIAVSPHEVRGRADRARAAVRGLAGVPAGDRGRRLPDRGDGQDRRPVLLLQGDPADAPAAARVGAAGGARSRLHQRRARRLGGGRARAHRARARPRRPRVPPHRPAAAARRRPDQRAGRRRARPALRGEHRQTAHRSPAQVAAQARSRAAAAAPGAQPGAARPGHPRGGARAHGAGAPLRHARSRARARRLAA